MSQNENELSPLPEGGTPADPVAWAAMAEAFRAQAEMVQRVHETQRALLEKLQKNDKAPEVLASTRSLNETFKGLSEIQRGLLDAVVKKDRGGPLPIAALVLVACMLAFLVYDRAGAESTVPASDHARTVERARGLELAVSNYKAAEPVLQERTRQLEQRSKDAEQRNQESTRRAEKAETALAAANKENEKLLTEAAARDAQLSEFVLLKQQAEEAGRAQLENVDLTRRLRAAEARAERLDKERERLASMLLEERIEGRSPVNEVLAAANERGLIPKPTKAGDASIPLRGAAASTFARRLNRAFPERGRRRRLRGGGGARDRGIDPEGGLDRPLPGRQAAQHLVCQDVGDPRGPRKGPDRAAVQGRVDQHHVQAREPDPLQRRAALRVPAGGRSGRLAGPVPPPGGARRRRYVDLEKRPLVD